MANVTVDTEAALDALVTYIGTTDVSNLNSGLDGKHVDKVEKDNPETNADPMKFPVVMIDLSGEREEFVKVGQGTSGGDGRRQIVYEISIWPFVKMITRTQSYYSDKEVRTLVTNIKGQLRTRALRAALTVAIGKQVIRVNIPNVEYGYQKEGGLIAAAEITAELVVRA